MFNTPHPYLSKEEACPTDLSLQMLRPELLNLATEADSTLQLVEEVYADWSDGGDTEGLKDYILDPAHDSYAVRNRLMLVAPKVSAENWSMVFFERQPPLNPWHLAQALLANSPLEKKVIEMMDSLDVEPFYKELVEDGQNGGVSMHTLYKSEIAHFNRAKSGRLHDLVALAVQDSVPDHAYNARVAVSGLGLHDAAAEEVALHLANNEFGDARTVVDSMLNASPDNRWFQLQDHLLELLENEHELTEADGATLSLLADAAEKGEEGSGEALAWLMMLGEEYDEEIVLPNRNKARRTIPEPSRTNRSNLLSAYPNPSNGPVYLVYRIPEGVEQAEIQVHDAAGRLLMQRRIAPRNGIVEVLPKELSTGLHIAGLNLDGLRVGTSKIEVMH